MKRFASKTTSIPAVQHEAPRISPPAEPQIFDIEMLLSQSGTILSREIRNLLIASSGGKLDQAGSRDLVSYIKLLNELKMTQSKELSNMSPEELEELAKVSK